MYYKIVLCVQWIHMFLFLIGHIKLYEDNFSDRKLRWHGQVLLLFTWIPNILSDVVMLISMPGILTTCAPVA